MSGRLNSAEARLESIERKTILCVDGRIILNLPESMSGGYLRSLGAGMTDVTLFDGLSEEKVRNILGGAFPITGVHGGGGIDSIDLRSLELTKTAPGSDELVDKLRLYGSYLKAVPCVSSTSMLYLEFRSKKQLLKTSLPGGTIRDAAHVIIFNVVANITRDKRTLALMKSFCFSGGEDLRLNLSREELVHAVLGSYANEENGLRDLRPGRYTCVFNPQTSSYLFHEMLGHLLEADLIYNHPLLLQGKLKVGSRISNECVSFFDDPTLEGHSGHYSFDDEGTPAKKVDLVTEGRVTGHLNNQETAHILKAEPNGHARTIDYHFLPFVRMSTTYPQPGKLTPEQMISGIDKGIYIEDSMLAKNDLENFVLLPKEIYLVEKGRITDQLAPLNVFGNIFEFLGNIQAVGNDLEFYEVGCTKGYADAWIPVTTGGSSLCVRDVRLGGSIL